MPVQLHSLTAQQLEDKTLQYQLGEVYQAAFNIQKKSEGAERLAEMLEMHRSREGLLCFIAQNDADQRIVGFIYGYTSRPGYWWFDTVSRAMSRTALQIWFEHAFEVVELAVHPSFQGQGIGGRLHDSLLAALPPNTYTTALLSTDPGETNARHLYNKRGWVPLLEDFYFPGRRTPMVIMGLDLEAHT